VPTGDKEVYASHALTQRCFQDMGIELVECWGDDVLMAR